MIPFDPGLRRRSASSSAKHTPTRLKPIGPLNASRSDADRLGFAFPERPPPSPQRRPFDWMRDRWDW